MSKTNKIYGFTAFSIIIMVMAIIIIIGFLNNQNDDIQYIKRDEYIIYENLGGYNERIDFRYVYYIKVEKVDEYYLLLFYDRDDVLQHYVYTKTYHVVSEVDE